MPIIHTDTSASTNLATATTGRLAGDVVVIDADVHYVGGNDISNVELLGVDVRDDARLFGNGTSMIVDLSGATSYLIMRSSEPCYVAGGGAGGEIQTATILAAPKGIWFTAGIVPLVEQAAGTSNFGTGVDVQVIRASGGIVEIETHASATVDALTIANTVATVRRTLVGPALVYTGAELVTDDRSIELDDVSVWGGWTINNGDVNGDIVLYPGSSVDFSTLDTDMVFGATLTVWPGVTVTGNIPVGVDVTFPGTVTKIAGGSNGPWG